jgi:uncharacterized protein YoxC
MTILEISQIVFNLVISTAVIVVAVFISVIAYDIIRFTRAIKKFMDGVNRELAELYNKINSFLETLLSLSFVSKLFKKNKK